MSTNQMMIKTEFTLGGLEYSAILPSPMTWEELKATAFRFGDGWRVPERYELIRLFDQTKESRDNSFVWSASASAFNSDFAWVVFFDIGVSCNINRTHSYDVRLVREI